MELKPRYAIYLNCAVFYLLIVPYGIETGSFGGGGLGVYVLLIVPYGIETKFL